MNWAFYPLKHSLKNQINLYVRSIDGERIEIYITEGSDEGDEKSLLVHDILYGSIHNLSFDQYSTPIYWYLRERNFEKHVCEMDMAEARAKHGNKDELDFIKYHVSNAINATFKNRGFSRYVKSKVVGTWLEEEFKLTIYNNGKFDVVGQPRKGTTLFGIPKEGSWSLNRNMIYFTQNNLQGIRTQIVNIDNDVILFPVFSGNLFYKLNKNNTMPNNS